VEYIIIYWISIGSVESKDMSVSSGIYNYILD